ncbi:MAG: DciA family protein [Alphaproteobacteria bacterium]|nr:DciA family protein [Alphaproteobacteria bacterium]
MYKPRTLADAVDKVARQSAGKDWGLYANLLEHWVEIVGAEYARVTTPVKITFPYQPNEAQRKNGVLTVRLPKGLAMEFSFKADLIRQRVNAYFGYEAFTRVALDPAALPPPEVKIVKKPDPAILHVIKEQASVIENKELREVLESFGEAVFGSDKHTGST